jgi:hypothetical protein
MNVVVGTFPEVEAAYRRERISASFRDHASSPHRYFFRWHKHTLSQAVPQRALRAA